MGKMIANISKEDEVRVIEKLLVLKAELAETLKFMRENIDAYHKNP